MSGKNDRRKNGTDAATVRSTGGGRDGSRCFFLLKLSGGILSFSLTVHHRHNNQTLLARLLVAVGAHRRREHSTYTCYTTGLTLEQQQTNAVHVRHASSPGCLWSSPGSKRRQSPEMMVHVSWTAVYMRSSGMGGAEATTGKSGEYVRIGTDLYTRRYH